MNETTILKEKLDELEAILESTKELEKRQKANVRTHYQKRQLIAFLRATSYVMLYNALESAMRSVMRSIRENIESEGVSSSEVAEYWRLDIVQAAFLDRMQAGTNHGNLLTDFVPFMTGRPSWDGPKKDRLPFSGNFGQTAAVKLRDSLAITWVAPPHTLGGSDLENVRERRNALAHGLESFTEAGEKVTASDLLEMLERVRRFMLSYLAALEEYRECKGYLKPLGEGLGIDAGPEGTPDSSGGELLQNG
ncbi:MULTISPECIES: MAE_28990/MAE_18760 family HEPN-like nuclease [unclassified Mesorhizobium]|uniref:MAE_28990/MAE_18760 family HEPN-like nuclease n=1 Tax=unclassified Mesorhizobium TaxID=325217 RepID=UPI001128DEAA|nr:MULTISPECIES: MAE_28990/MAE_18760 family HEPN-like nuclease [unclassified Mesorhizobium]MBZ9697064.1 hypothetical protein [Mesorhizobium sp. CO1-1-9]TPK13491.1 hypothetical protein FJ543_17075 [Mesorhizobium sp. B2-5-7]